MTTLVTGATGFIGSAVVRRLLARGRAVRALVEPGAPTANLDGLEVERVTGSILDPDALAKAAAGATAIYHLAAIYSLWLPDERVGVEDAAGHALDLESVEVRGRRAGLDQRPHRAAAREQAADHRGADEAGGAGHQGRHHRSVSRAPLAVLPERGMVARDARRSHRRLRVAPAVNSSGGRARQRPRTGTPAER